MGPWYRQFWPWVLILLPGTSVVGGLALVFIALHEPDGLVVDDYYKQGLLINQVLERDQHARALGLWADITVEEGWVRLSLQGTNPLDEPELQLRWLHPTRANLDVDMALYPTIQGAYQGRLTAELPPGDWHLLLEPRDETWRLTGRLRIPSENSLRLSASSGR